MPGILNTIIDSTHAPIELHVQWIPQSAPLPPHAADFLDRRWQTYVAESKAAGGMLFNGPITRLIDTRIQTSEKITRLTLLLGPADYKTFVVTRLRDRNWFQANSPDSMVLALGNSALLTHGDQALLGIRSHRVGAYPGKAHLFGGVAELLATEQFPATPAGLIAHLRLELHEEVGLTPHDLAASGPKLLGLAQDDFLGQPELFWQWETTRDLHQLARRLDDAEHAGAMLLHRGTVTPDQSDHMTPVARRTIEIWSNEK